MLKPFESAKPGTLGLVSQDANSWILNAQVNEPILGMQSLRGMSAQLTIDKTTGMLREIAMDDQAASISVRMTISDVKINPDLPDSMFAFAPPDGVPVMDMTDTYIQQMQAQTPPQP